MNKTATIATSLLFSLSLLFTGCGGGGTVVVPNDPVAAGEQVKEHYVEAIGELNALLGQDLSAEELKPKAEELLNKYIAKFIAIGHVRETFSEEDQGIFAENSETSGILPAEEYKVYLDGLDKYRTEDEDLGKILAEFNILSLYSNFKELRGVDASKLKKQGLDEYLEKYENKD